MRNPDRLNDFYTYISKIHRKTFPDLRFGQLMINFIDWLKKNDKRDIYYIEEYEMIELFSEYALTYNPHPYVIKPTNEDFFKKYFEEIDNAKHKVSTPEYIEWLCEFVNKEKVIDDISALYQYSEINSENAKLLSYFIDYLKVLFNIPEDIYEEYEEYVFTYKDKYYKASKMFGQGCKCVIRLLKEKPDCAIINLT